MPEYITVAALFEKFDVASVTQGTTRTKCRSAWKVLVGLVGPGFPAVEVGPEHVLRYQRYLRDEAVSRYGRSYGEHSIFSYTAAVGQVFRWAVQQRYVPVNPVGNVDRIKPTKRGVHIFTPDEIRDMLDTVRGDPEREIVSLAWPDRAGCLRWTAFLLMGLIGEREGERRTVPRKWQRPAWPVTTASRFSATPAIGSPKRSTRM